MIYMCSRPDIWPTRIQIARRSPLSRAQILQKQAIENKLPFCQFRPLNTSTQQDQTNFSLLLRNLEQKKYASTKLGMPCFFTHSCVDC